METTQNNSSLINIESWMLNRFDISVRIYQYEYEFLYGCRL